MLNSNISAPKIRSTTNNNEPVITTPKSDDTGKQLILVGLIGLGLTIVGVVALGILLLKKKKEVNLIYCSIAGPNPNLECQPNL